MFSFTIAEFTFLCVGFAFVGSLILFPSFRQQLKALAGGFLQVFVQDTATRWCTRYLCSEDR